MLQISRTSLYHNSLPSALKLQYGTLSSEVQNLESWYSFKSHLTQNISKYHKYFYVGERQWQSYHARLRTEISMYFRKTFLHPPPPALLRSGKQLPVFLWMSIRYIETTSTICTVAL